VSEEAKILVVEDEVDLAEMLSTYLRTDGYHVTAVGWGEDAIQAVNDSVPDLITLDINLPDIDGYEVCRQIRDIRRAENVPVIFLTNRKSRKNKLAGLELGAVDYITKPFDVQELSLRVKNALRRSQLRTLDNPITGLPEGRLVRERLVEMLAQTEWAVVITGFDGLNDFRNKYGFVAADDVVRAAGIMIDKALAVSGAAADFRGHTDMAEFLIVTSPERADTIVENCYLRLETSIPYFYPVLEQEPNPDIPASDRLSVRAASLKSSGGRISNFNDLRQALTNDMEPYTRHQTL